MTKRQKQKLAVYIQKDIERLRAKRNEINRIIHAKQRKLRETICAL